jgi:hypothetical protein
VSEVNSQSKHDPLSFESSLAFRRVSHLVPENVPVILESRVDQDGIDAEIENARKALNVEDVLALTGDSNGSPSMKTYFGSPRPAELLSRPLLNRNRVRFCVRTQINCSSDAWERVPGISARQ